MFLTINEPHEDIPDPRQGDRADPHHFYNLYNNITRCGAYYSLCYHGTPELHAEYAALFDQVLRDHQPGSAMEFDICHQLANAAWRGLFLLLAKDEADAMHRGQALVDVHKYSLPTYALNFRQFEKEASGFTHLWSKLRGNQRYKENLLRLLQLFREQRLTRHQPPRKEHYLFNHVHKRKDRSIMQQARSIEQAHQDSPAEKPNPSTGPKTEDGKARSSQNARKMGIWSRYIELASPQEAYDFGLILQGFQETYQPKGLTEEGLVHDLARARFNRLRMELADERQWNENIAEMIDLRTKQGHPDPHKNVEVDVLKTFDLATSPNIARRLRAARSAYNQALKQLNEVQRRRRLEAAEKAKQAKETARVEQQAQQEATDRATATNQEPNPPGEFVPATAETPPETDL